MKKPFKTSKESTENKIRRCVQYYKNGIICKFSLAARMKVHHRTISKWQQTDLWQELLPDINFKIPTRRKKLLLFARLKQRYMSMIRVPEHNRIGILLRDPECTVTPKTLYNWRKKWRKTM